jgi:hypothetical protein
VKYVVSVARRRHSTPVLGKSKSKAGGKALNSVDDILTSDQRRELRDDLSKIAQTRREAEVSSQSLRFK